MAEQNWPGIANGEQPIAWKAAARRGHDLPEWVDIDIRQKLQTQGDFTLAWQNGLVDIEGRDGKAYLGLSHRQTAAWGAPGRHHLGPAGAVGGAGRAGRQNPRGNF